jgi:hypothetical protein
VNQSQSLWPRGLRHGCLRVRLFCVCVLCVGSGLEAGWYPVQGILLSVYRIKKLQKRPRPVARPLPKHRTQTQNNRIHALSGIRTHDHSVRASEDSSYLRPRGHCDRLNCELQVLNMIIIFVLYIYVVSVCVLSLMCVCIAAFRLQKPHTGDSANGRWRAPVHVWHQRAQPKRLGHLCKYLANSDVTYQGT